MDRPTCATCPFWEKRENASNDFPDSVGECRRLPPPRPYDNDEGNWFGEWLCVYDDDWCGEHPSFPAYLASLSPAPSGSPVPRP